MTWTPTQQARHRATLLAAFAGPDPADPSWAAVAAQFLGNERLPRVERPRWRQIRAADADQAPAICPACLAGSHGQACEGRSCVCRCRAMLGLEGPFPFGDPTATGLHDVRDPDEEWVA